MIWGVFSDTHSNIEALDAVLKSFSEQQVQGYICCGDLVGYGPNPNEVVERIAGLKPLHIVSGNHDLAVVGRMDLQWFNSYAQAAVVWTRWKLSTASAQFLEALPNRVESELFTIVHGAPRNPSEEYLVTPQQFVDNLSHFKASPCFLGHSHLPWCFGVDDASKFGGMDWGKAPISPAQTRKLELEDRQSVKIPANIPWVLNPGSVGQPRDQDSRASCGVYDDVKREFKLLRVPYDILAVQNKMKEAGLPEFLALRLSLGQ